MITSLGKRSVLTVALALVTGACATSPNAFTRHDDDMAQRALDEANADRRDCPVVVANSTDQHLDVVYRAGGMRNELGIIPAGQRTGFQLPCSLESVRAYGTVALEGLYTPHQEFETRARLDRTGVAVLHFTEMHAVR
jgi:hypothetical protein